MAEKLRDKVKIELDAVLKDHRDFRSIISEKLTRRISSQRTHFDNRMITFASKHDLELPPFPELHTEKALGQRRKNARLQMDKKASEMNEEEKLEANTTLQNIDFIFGGQMMTKPK